MNNLLMQKRLKRAKDKDMVFEILDIKKNKKTGFFRKMTDIYVFALSLGIKERKISPIIGGSSEAIAIDLFSENQRKYFDTVILFASAGDIGRLNKEDDDIVQSYMKTIEEYANGGLEILKERILIHPEDSFNIINRMIFEKLSDDIPEEAKEELQW